MLKQPNENEEDLQPLYNIKAHNGQFICEVVLPETSPIRSMVGKPKTRKSWAKRSAALKLCEALRQPNHGHLDQNWLPTYIKKLHAFRNAQLAVSSKKTNLYEMKTKPSLWDAGKGALTCQLYLSVIDVLSGLDRPHHPIGLLTRRPLPKLPNVPLFLDSGRETEVVIFSLGEALPVDEKTISCLTKYTLRAWLDIWNKEYEDDDSKISYWLVPLRSICASKGPTTKATLAKDLIDWESVEIVAQHDEYSWTAETTESWLVDRFLVDRWSGGRRFFAQNIMSNLRPGDPVPADAVKLDSNKFSDSILNYTVRLWKNSRDGKEWSQDQPVLLVEQMSNRQNLLVEPTNKEKSLRLRAYVCPQPLKISAVSCYRALIIGMN